MKKLTWILCAAVLLALGILLGACAGGNEVKEMELSYDDRKNLTQLLGKKPGEVEIIDQQPTSFQLGTQTPDQAVLLYEPETDTLYAVGTGTATLMAAGDTYTVTVKPAVLSLFLITGHSIGYGQEGNALQSVAVEPGQGYSSWYRHSLPSPEGGLGYGSAMRAGSRESAGLDAFNKGQGGSRGVGSGLAYEWNRLTGEKAWVINLAVGGSCLNEWIPGARGHQSDEARQYKYKSVLTCFGYAQQITRNEIAAGHYTLGHMAMFYFSGANFSYAGYEDWTQESLKQDYEALWEGLKKDLAMDMDGDGQPETLEAMGLVPFWSPTNTGYGTDKAANYYMAASEEYPDVFLASTVYRGWMDMEGLSSFPAIDYEPQKTAVRVPVSVLHSANGGTSAESVFSVVDNVHLSQVAYNALGMDMARNAQSWFAGNTTITQAHFEDVDAKELETLRLRPSQEITLVPVFAPVYGNGLRIQVTGPLELIYPLGLRATGEGEGTVTLLVNGQVLDALQVTVKASVVTGF